MENSLFAYAKNGEYKKICNLEENKIDFNAQDANGCTAMHYACLNGHLEVFKYLHKKGANFMIKDNEGYYAANKMYLDPFTDEESMSAKQLDIFLYAFEEGFDVCTRTPFGNTFLDLAALGHHSSMVRKLSKDKSSISRALLKICEDIMYDFSFDEHSLDRIKMIEQLIANGADINFTQRGETPILCLLSSGFVESGEKKKRDAIIKLIRIFVDNGASVTTPGGLANETASEYIINWSYHELYDIIEVIDVPRALEIACRKNNKDIVKILLSQGADVDARLDSSAPVHIATVYEDLEILQILNDAQADFNLLTNSQSNKISVLHIAVNNECNIEIIKTLLNYGSDINLKGMMILEEEKVYLTPFELATKLGYDHFISLFRKHNKN